jgi:hypothetical protein
MDNYGVEYDLSVQISAVDASIRHLWGLIESTMFGNLVILPWVFVSVALLPERLIDSVRHHRVVIIAFLVTSLVVTVVMSWAYYLPLWGAEQVVPFRIQTSLVTALQLQMLMTTALFWRSLWPLTRSIVPVLVLLLILRRLSNVLNESVDDGYVAWLFWHLKRLFDHPICILIMLITGSGAHHYFYVRSLGYKADGSVSFATICALFLLGGMQLGGTGQGYGKANNVALIRNEYHSGLLACYREEMLNRHYSFLTNRPKNGMGIVCLADLNCLPLTVQHDPQIEPNRKPYFWNWAYERWYGREEVYLEGDTVRKWIVAVDDHS